LVVWPSEFLTGYSAAAGIALINSVGNLGGLLGPFAIGVVTERSGALSAGLALAAVPVFLAATLVLLLPKTVRPLDKAGSAPPTDVS
jgi:ACS family tartrate transporter-like MFS transporter